jgi:hypothetical protein
MALISVGIVPANEFEFMKNAVITLRRPSNVDNVPVIRLVLNALREQLSI